jgi:ParB-like chromosome segregation protein Spo0J
MTRIALKQLHPDPRNANVCGPSVLEKLRRHMERSGFCPSLLVRPHPKRSKHYIVVDGHHRLMVAQLLGWKEIDCQIKEMTDEEAGLLLLTLNRLRGTDMPRKRAELIESLLGPFSLNDLSLMLPESGEEIEGLLALIKQDEDALEKAFDAQMEEERQTLPVPFGFMLSAEDAALVREALAFYQARRQSDQGDALVAICRDALSCHEVDDGQAQT